MIQSNLLFSKFFLNDFKTISVASLGGIEIKIFSEAFDLSNLNYFYLDDLKPYQKKTLSILGMEKIKVISSKKYRHIQANELFATEHPWYFKGTILDLSLIHI